MDVPLFGIQEYRGQTLLHPVGLAAVVVLGIAMLCLPRHRAIVPVLVMACFIAPGQRIAVFSLNFDLLRIMVLFGSARLLIRGEWRGFVWKPMDIALVLWAVVGATAYILLYQSAAALQFKLGNLYDIIGLYFLFRMLVRNWRDVDGVTAGFMVIVFFVAVAFVLERATGRNVFSVFGGVPEITEVREGRLRCQGAYAHPILAGCFWAGVAPMLAARVFRGHHTRVMALGSLVACCTVILLCSSSTPVMGLAFGVVGCCFIPLRHWMRCIRWGAVVMLIALHCAMKGPVWSLVARVDLAGGSTGYHRSELIDQAIRRVDEWWLIGTASTAHWGFGLFDVTNQFVMEGVRGGALALILFVVTIGLAFQQVGRLCRAVSQERTTLILAWSLGVSLFVHCTNFIGISYFGQINMLWYLQLAMIGSLVPYEGTGLRRPNQVDTKCSAKEVGAHVRSP